MIAGSWRGKNILQRNAIIALANLHDRNAIVKLMEQMMRQMGLNPNNLPKNMPNMPDMENMDMSALEGMMGGTGMPDLGNMDLSQMLGGGLKGKIGSFAMKHAMKRQANKLKKAKKKRK